MINRLMDGNDTSKVNDMKYKIMKRVWFGSITGKKYEEFTVYKLEQSLFFKNWIYVAICDSLEKARAIENDELVEYR